MNKILHIFFRDKGFYSLKFESDDEARRNADCNPGTLRVETYDGKQVWPKN